MRKRPKKVIVALAIANTPGRRWLGGILKYANSGHPWNLQILGDQRELSPQRIALAEADGTDGIITMPDEHNAAALAGSRIPLVVLCDRKFPALLKRREAIVFIRGDELTEGRCCADFFRSRGYYASYGFVPDCMNSLWSRLRERGFRQRLGEFSCAVSTFGSRTCTLPEWLKRLSKPAAVMAAYDFRAKDVLEACKEAGIEVPGQVSIIGVDNDELVCDYTSPTISSLAIDHSQSTYAAAKVLDEMMCSRKPCPAAIKVLPFGGKVVERESTDYAASSAHIVTRAKDFIAQNACNGITVEDVIRHLGVSRRLAYLRFSRQGGPSIRRQIENCRLEKVKHYLRTTHLPIGKISSLCGYANNQRLKYIFKARTGMTMTEWRRA